MFYRIPDPIRNPGVGWVEVDERGSYTIIHVRGSSEAHLNDVQLRELAHALISIAEKREREVRSE